ncbi:MAG TPA: AarF/ABC1/UbiB kinase family protein [candidate division Zixibacteria bacterium]|nr:AarF/ABC1/UbiB kinase family protein [candidate division Zixibacteria bacterium]
MLLLRPRQLNRYRQIAEVMARHGFGAIIAELGLESTISLPLRILRRERGPVTRRSAAIHLRLALEELGPTFIKIGQIASARPELLPRQFIEELSKLQDDVPPSPWEEVQPLIEKELGASIQDTFLAFDPTPIASASLAMVYAALLPDRTKVIVKVQRPNIERVIETDLTIIRDIARQAAERIPPTRVYDPVGLADEFAVALQGELDYESEGRNADRFRENFESEEFLYIPAVYWEYTTSNIMVQERIEGIKADDIERLDLEGYDRDIIAMNAARFIIKEILEDGFFHADPHPGNMFILPGNLIGLMDFGTVGYLDDSDRTKLIRLYAAVIRFDVEAIVEQLIQMRIAGPSVDEAGLQRDLRRLLRKYYGLPLKQIAVDRLLSEIQPIIFEYHLQIPSDYWLLLKTLVVMEGVGKRLAPDFDVFAVSRPYVSRFLVGLVMPTSWGPGILRDASGWIDLVTGFPRQSRRILGQLERGNLQMRVDVPAINESTRQMNRMANRVILAILVGSLTIGLSLLIPSLDLTWPWGLATWALVLGFLLIVTLAFWLIWSILRSNRR